MFSTSLTTIAATGFAVAFFHAALPTHWLPFVLVGHARHWSHPKTLAVTLVAGAGHVLLTSLLGLAIASFGFQVDERLERTFPWLAGGFLLAMGGYYTWRQFRGMGTCRHVFSAAHHDASACCSEESAVSSSQEERTIGSKTPGSSHPSELGAIIALFMMLTFSPCEGFLPVYLSGGQFGWHGFVVLSAILAIATLFGMFLFTLGTLLGVEKLGMRRLGRYQAGVLGTLFSALGLSTLVFGH